MSLNFTEFIKNYPDDESCFNYIFNLKFGKDFICPKCQLVGKWYRVRNRKIYSCQCGYNLYPCKDTIFEKSRTSLQLWFYAIYLFSTSRHGVAAKELQRQLGVTYKTAWRMANKIRKHMIQIEDKTQLSGVIEVDETYVGGKKRKGYGRGTTKTPLVGIVERGGRVKTRVVGNVGRKALEREVRDHVEKGSLIYSDEWYSYNQLDRHGYEHQTIKHSTKEYVRGAVHTNTIEGYWSRLKNSIRGTHIFVSKKYLHSYAAEFDFRYNRRSNPSQIFVDLIGNL